MLTLQLEQFDNIRMEDTFRKKRKTLKDNAVEILLRYFISCLHFEICFCLFWGVVSFYNLKSFFFLFNLFCTIFHMLIVK